MSETSTHSPEPRRGAPRWMKVVLVLSLALNLLVIGAIIGAVTSGAGKWRGAHGPGAAGALTKALSEEDRRAIKRQMVREFMPQREARQAHRATMATLLEQLRAPEFDAAAVSASMTQIGAHFQTRFDTGQMLLVERLSAMSAAERAAYADRLEAALTRRKR